MFIAWEKIHEPSIYTTQNIKNQIIQKRIATFEDERSANSETNGVDGIDNYFNLTTSLFEYKNRAIKTMNQFSNIEIIQNIDNVLFADMPN